jgi:hypothetical protein
MTKETSIFYRDAQLRPKAKAMLSKLNWQFNRCAFFGGDYNSVSIGSCEPSNFEIYMFHCSTSFQGCFVYAASSSLVNVGA